jgi:hypothetical protein
MKPPVPASSAQAWPADWLAGQRERFGRAVGEDYARATCGLGPERRRAGYSWRGNNGRRQGAVEEPSPSDARMLGLEPEILREHPELARP